MNPECGDPSRSIDSIGLLQNLEEVKMVVIMLKHSN